MDTHRDTHAHRFAHGGAQGAQNGFSCLHGCCWIGGSYLHRRHSYKRALPIYPCAHIYTHREGGRVGEWEGSRIGEGQRGSPPPRRAHSPTHPFFPFSFQIRDPASRSQPPESIPSLKDSTRKSFASPFSIYSVQIWGSRSSLQISASRTLWPSHRDRKHRKPNKACVKHDLYLCFS